MRPPPLPHAALMGYCSGLCLAAFGGVPWWALVLAAAAGGVVVLAGGGGQYDDAASGHPLAAPLSGSAGGLSRGPTDTASRARQVVVPIGLALIFVAAGSTVGGQRLAALERSDLAAHVGQRVELVGELTDLPAVKDDRVTLALDATAVDGHAVAEPAHLQLRLGDDERFTLDPCGPLTEGAVVRVAAVAVRPLPEAEPGRFDYGRYLRRRGEHVLLEGRFADLRVAGRRGGLAGAVDRLRLASRAHLRAGVGPPVADILQGMVLGDDEGVAQEHIDDFRRSGLLHIMAVSGENVVLLCCMWSFAFTLLGIPRLARTLLLVPVVCTYVLLTGADPSIVRAGVAGVLGLLAILVSRPSDGWLLWLAPGAWLLTANPNNLFDVSFQLSFAAVAGLLLIARPLAGALAFLPRPVCEQVSVTTAASLATAPVSILVFGSASVVSVPANVAGGFVLGPIMFLGMLSLLLGFVGAWLSVPLNVLAGLFVGFLIEVARVFGRLPWAVYEWGGVTLPLVLAAALVLQLLALRLLAARAGSGLVAYVTASSRRTPLVAATACVVAAALLLAPAPPSAPGTLTMTFLDVGEGAATLMQVPRGPTVLVDAGPEPLARQLRDHGVRRIDLLVLSHGHDDHAAGLEDVVGRLAIGTALLPRPQAPSEALDRLEASLRASGAEVRRVTEPVTLTGDGWGLRVLPASPPPGTSGNQAENDDALVAVVELGLGRVLLPGDAEGSALGALDLPPCAVVALPHHGSSGGLDAALLERLAPSLAVIPVGPNSYGHPSSEMLELLAGAGVPFVRTDEHGDTAVWVGGGELRVSVAGGG